MTTTSTKRKTEVREWTKPPGMGLIKGFTLLVLLIAFGVGGTACCGLFLLAMLDPNIIGRPTGVLGLAAGVTCLAAAFNWHAIWHKIRDQAGELQRLNNLQGYLRTTAVQNRPWGDTLRDTTANIFMFLYPLGALAALGGGAWRYLKYDPHASTTNLTFIAVAVVSTIAFMELIGLGHVIKQRADEIWALQSERETPRIKKTDAAPVTEVLVTADNVGHYFVTVPDGTERDLARLMLAIEQLTNVGYLKYANYPSRTDDCVVFKLGALVHKLPEDYVAQRAATCAFLGQYIGQLLHQIRLADTAPLADEKPGPSPDERLSEHPTEVDATLKAMIAAALAQAEKAESYRTDV